MRRTSLSLLISAAALCVPAAANAAPPWSPSAPAGGTGTQVKDPVLHFGARSAGIATWSAGEAAGEPRVLAPVVVGQAPVAQRAGRSVAVGPLPYGSSRTLSIRRRSVGGGVVRVGYSFGKTTGAVGRLRTLDHVRGLVDVDAAVARNGHAVVAYVERRGTGTRLLAATRRASSSRFSRPRVIRGSGRQSSVAVDVTISGRLVVAYQQVDVRSPGGRRIEGRAGGTAGGVRGVQRLGRTLGRADIDAVVARTGRTTVAWATADAGEEQNQPTSVYAAMQPAGSFSFRDAREVDRGPAGIEQADGPLSVGAADDGSAVVAYTLNGPFLDGDERTAVRAARQGPGGRFFPPQELTPDGVAGRVAVRSDGAAVVPFVERALLASPSPVRAGLLAPGATTFTIEQIATDGAPRTPAAAYEPGTGVPAVLYVAADQQMARSMRFSRRG